MNDIGETGEGSVGLRHGETAADSDALTEGVGSLMFFLLRDIEYLSPTKPGVRAPVAPAGRRKDTPTGSRTASARMTSKEPDATPPVPKCTE